MRLTAKMKAFWGLISNLFHKPVTVRGSFGFIASSSRGLPRRDETRCTGCGACNERCSSGATSITDSENQRTVSIDSLRCIFCARCADVCPEKALDLTFGSGYQDEECLKELPRRGVLGDEPDRLGIRDQDIDVPVSHRYAQLISLSHDITSQNLTVDTTLVLQRCRVCGELMPVTEKYLQVISDRVISNLEEETAAIIREDMKLYLTACISCRQKLSMKWNTHPRKFI